MDISLMTKVARAMELAMLDGAIKAADIWIAAGVDANNILFPAAIGTGLSQGLIVLDEIAEKTMGKRPGFFTRGIGVTNAEVMEGLARLGQKAAEKTVSDVEAAAHVEGDRDPHPEQASYDRAEHPIISDTDSFIAFLKKHGYYVGR